MRASERRNALRAACQALTLSAIVMSTTLAGILAAARDDGSP